MVQLSFLALDPSLAARAAPRGDADGVVCDDRVRELCDAVPARAAYEYRQTEMFVTKPRRLLDLVSDDNLDDQRTAYSAERRMWQMCLESRAWAPLELRP